MLSRKVQAGNYKFFNLKNPKSKLFAVLSPALG
jgi:hypothetical protein